MKYFKYLFIGFIIMLIVVLYSCLSYYHDNFSYLDYYYKVKENCYVDKNYDSSYCSRFKINNIVNDENLTSYIQNFDPNNVRKRMDVMTVTSEIVEMSFFSTMQLFSPLIILFIVICTLQAEFTSGYFKNSLLREDYKKYLKKKYKIVPLVSLLMPISLLIIFIFSCFLTNFNFDTSNVNVNLAVYDEWKYNNFIVYGFLICIIQFFISMLYANIGLMCIRKNKNSIVSIIMGYLYFVFVYIFIYVGLYVFVINKFFGIKELSEYFNIIGYWFFTKDTNIIVVAAMSFIFQFISFLYVLYEYKCKEKMVLSYEKQVS